MPPDNPALFERIASMETEVRIMRETMERLADANENLVKTIVRLESVQRDLGKIEDSIKAHDTDIDLVGKRLDALEQKQWKVNWLVAGLITAVATVGGWVLQRIIALIH